MPALKLSSGAVFTTIGWLLTADALLGALAFVAVWQSVAEFGGRFPPRRHLHSDVPSPRYGWTRDFAWGQVPTKVNRGNGTIVPMSSVACLCPVGTMHNTLTMLSRFLSPHYQS